MAQSIVTRAFEAWNVKKTLDGQPAVPDQIVFALIPNQDENQAVSRDEGMPAAAAIKHRAAITQAGILNINAVVYSVVLDTTIGDWDYNWIGLVDSKTNTVLMIVHVRTQQKLKTRNGQQGNSLTRNLSMQFDGAAEATQINVSAATWQIDFSARLFGMDEAHRLAMRDYYGAAAFLNDGFRVSLANGVATVEAGVGYVGGLRARLDAAAALNVSANTAIWLDVSRQGTVTGAWENRIMLTTATALADYIDDAGYQHYVAKVADIVEGGVVDNRKPPVIQWAQIKNVPAASSDVAGVVTLGSGVLDNSTTVAASTRLVWLARNVATGALAKASAALPADGTAVAANKLATPRTIAGVPFDGTENIELTANRIGALPVNGMAVEAVKAHWLAEPRKINGVPFDGKADITLPQDFPVGVPIPYPLSIPPVGWIKCNGQSFNKNLYTILASIYPSGVLPDLRGEFVRGWDDGRGVDSGRALLSLQSDEFKSHAHGNVPLYRYPSGDSDRGVGNFSWFSVDDLGITETAGGNETRPRNIAFNYIVRAA
ncbi:phage tail protein [Pectobacterium parvum]|uniref:phage tail-collar fiber domain-containing protein n=1 Tax=Pectobacterium TaxID=122277 RepID=UPI0013FD9AD9|nr:phage tail protein [Pectobacterium polaris]